MASAAPALVTPPAWLRWVLPGGLLLLELLALSVMVDLPLEGPAMGLVSLASPLWSWPSAAKAKGLAMKANMVVVNFSLFFIFLFGC